MDTTAALDPAVAEQTSWTTIGRGGNHSVAGRIPGAPRRLVAKGSSGDAAAGEYELHEVIGEGGMGVVYAAHQSALGRVVALKRLRRDDDGARARFLAEAAVSGRLDHPNIVPIHDVGIDEQGLPFYTMKLVSGRPWSEALKTLSLLENLDILMRVADAVAFAHAHGVVHRDVKPGNVMLGAYGEVLLADWGLACEVALLRRTATIGAAGTPAYMAPEMAWGDTALIGPGSDIYLLGAVLYEILTGEPPHPGRTVRESIEAAAANRIDPAIPDGELGAIARRALAMETVDRFPTVQDLQQALRTYRTHADSERLAQKAQALIRLARGESGYAAYSRAMHACEEAQVLWPENALAADGLRTARNECAARALGAGDLDLAESLLDGSHPDDAPLQGRLAAAQHRRRRAHRRLQALSWMSGGLAVLVLVVLTVALAVVAAQYRQVVRATHARDDAESRLLRDETQRQRQGSRSWKAAHSEDFSNVALALPLLIEPNDWTITDGVLMAVHDGAHLQLPEPDSGDLRLHFDLINDHPLAVLLGVGRQDLRSAPIEAPIQVELGGECRIINGGKLLAVALMPAATPGLFDRILVEREGSLLRVLVNGRELLRRDIPPAVLPAAPHVVIRASAGAGIDNLRLDHLR